MHEMHRKMINAATPAERQARMADAIDMMQAKLDLMAGRTPPAGMGK